VRPDAGHDERGRLAALTAFLRRLPTRTGRLLDVGCGTGEFVRAAEGAGWEAHGVDASVAAVAAARRLSARIHASTRDLPDASFDVVTLWNVVEFFQRPLEELLEVRRLLVPGGLTVVRTPNAAYQIAACRLSRAAWPGPVAQVLRAAYNFNPVIFDPHSLRLALERAGFSRIVVSNTRPSPGDPYRRAPYQALAVGTVKRTLHGLVQGLATASRRRFLVGSSIEAIAARPRPSEGPILAAPRQLAAASP
jgi:SAM-dependent methyltransferase